MNIPWESIWDLFRFAILSALLAGLVCPLIGAFLLVRRTAFYGVALPQFASAGIAFGYAVLGRWIAAFGLAGLTYEEALADPQALRGYLVAWSAAFTFGGLWLLAQLGRRKELETSHVAAGFALASALTVLFAKASPVGLELVDSLMHGEILVVSLQDYLTFALAYGVVLGLFLLGFRDLLLVSFDPITARVMGKSVRRHEVLLALLVGLTVSVGVRIVGPIVLFGLLVIPPLAAQGVATSMASYFVSSSFLGVLSAAGGVYASFRLDWPLGPAVVMVAGLLLAVITGVRRFLGV